jgi:peptidoglycan lytic transglycosylase
MRIGAATLVLALPLLCLHLSSCGKKKRLPPASVARASIPSAAPVPSSESGLASWYGYPYHGRRAADGEIYDMEQLTAAHRTLPFGTWVHVINLTNEKTVDVRITDRGPFVDGRVIDLSHAAARAIDMIGPGVARVRLDILSVPPLTATAALFGVQAGAFKDKSRADLLRSEMEKQFGSARLVFRDGAPPLWRVVVGQEPTQSQAGRLAEQLRGELVDAFVVRLDPNAAQ